MFPSFSLIPESANSAVRCCHLWNEPLLVREMEACNAGVEGADCFLVQQDWLCDGDDGD